MELGKRPWRDEQGFERIRVSKLQLHKGYMKLEPSVGGVEQELSSGKRFSAAMSSGLQQKQQHQRRKWRFRVKPRVKVLYSTISRLLRRLRDSYAKVLLAMAAKARDTSLLTLRASLKTKPRTAIRNGSMFRYGSRSRSGDVGRELGVVETKYLDYIRRSATDGELAYYTMSLRSCSFL